MKLLDRPSSYFWLTAAIAFGVALAARGRVHPDEIFQMLEPAHRLAFGYGELTWEWQLGLRNWAAPGVFAFALWLLAQLRIDNPLALVAVLWALCSLWQGAGTLALFTLVRERDGLPAARMAALLHASWGGFAIYAARTLGDPLAVPAILLALAAVARGRRTGDARDAFLAGVWLGVAAVLRTPSLVFGIPLCASLLLARRARALAALSGGAALVLGTLAALDFFSWGSPLHSLLAYLAFNGPGGGVSGRFGTAPAWFYFGPFLAMAPVLLLPFAARGFFRGGLVSGCFATYLIALLVHPHKEARFLLPLTPLAIALAAGGLPALLGRSRRWLSVAAGAQLLSSVLAATLLLPVGLHRDLLDAEVAAGRDTQLKHLVVVDLQVWNTGGFFYLHRAVPVEYAKSADLPLRAAGSLASHALAEAAAAQAPLSSAGFRRTFSRGTASVWRRENPGAQRTGAGP